MNKKLLILAAATTSFYATTAQVEKPVDSNIANVTVFLNKAQVNREAKTRIEAGKTDLVFSGLTSQLDPSSIQVSGKGNFVIMGILHRQNYLNEFNLPRKLKILNDSMALVQSHLSLEQSQKEILGKEEQMLLSNQKIGGTNQNLSVGELKAMADFYRSRLTEIVNTRMKQDEKIKRLNEQFLRLQRQVKEQHDVYQRNTSEIVVSVSAESPTSASLEFNYVVANAGWFPQYDLRAINTKSPVQLNYKASVFQSTGEEWNNVNLKLSTANLNQSGLKPELYTWYLDFYNPVAYQLREKRQSDRSMPAAKSAGAAQSAEEDIEASSLSDFVSTVQTTLNTEFVIALPYTVGSGIKPTVVDIANHQMEAFFNYSVVPKLDAEAFLIGKAIGWEEFNLLPGEANLFFEGTFVGKTFIDPNNIKDTLSLSLGRDKRIVVKREKIKDITSRKLIGGSQRETHGYEIAVRNTKAEPIKITIEDQLPVARNTQIEVTGIDTGGAKLEAGTGKLTWELTLQPNETRKLNYRFEIKYPKDKQVTGL